MTKATLKRKIGEAYNATKEALQTVYDALNQGQQKKLLKDDKVSKLLKQYNIIIEGDITS